MKDFARILHDTPPVDPARPVLLPGEIELGRLERQRREGLRIDAEVLATLGSITSRSA